VLHLAIRHPPVQLAAQQFVVVPQPQSSANADMVPNVNVNAAITQLAAFIILISPRGLFFARL